MQVLRNLLFDKIFLSVTLLVQSSAFQPKFQLRNFPFTYVLSVSPGWTWNVFWSKVYLLHSLGVFRHDFLVSRERQPLGLAFMQRSVWMGVSLSHELLKWTTPTNYTLEKIPKMTHIPRFIIFPIVTYSLLVYTSLGIMYSSSNLQCACDCLPMVLKLGLFFFPPANLKQKETLE